MPLLNWLETIFFIGYDKMVCSENLLSSENCEEIKMIYGVVYKV